MPGTAQKGQIMLDFVYYGLVFFGGLLGGALIQLFVNGWVLRRLTSLENSIKGRSGQFKNQEQTQRLMEALAEASELHKQGKKPEEILKELAPRYLDLAPLLLKNLKRFI